METDQEKKEVKVAEGPPPVPPPRKAPPPLPPRRATAEKLNVSVELKSESEADSKPEARPKSEDGPRLEVEPKPEADSKPEVRPKPQTGDTSEDIPKLEAGSKPEAGPITEAIEECDNELATKEKSQTESTSERVCDVINDDCSNDDKGTSHNDDDKNDDVNVCSDVNVDDKPTSDSKILKEVERRKDAKTVEADREKNEKETNVDEGPKIEEANKGVKDETEQQIVVVVVVKQNEKDEGIESREDLEGKEDKVMGKIDKQEVEKEELKDEKNEKEKETEDLKDADVKICKEESIEGKMSSKGEDDLNDVEAEVKKEAVLEKSADFSRPEEEKKSDDDAKSQEIEKTDSTKPLNADPVAANSEKEATVNRRSTDKSEEAATLKQIHSASDLPKAAVSAGSLSEPAKQSSIASVSDISSNKAVNGEQSQKPVVRFETPKPAVPAGKSSADSTSVLPRIVTNTADLQSLADKSAVFLKSVFSSAELPKLSRTALNGSAPALKPSPDTDEESSPDFTVSTSQIDLEGLDGPTLLAPGAVRRPRYRPSKLVIEGSCNYFFWMEKIAMV